MKRPTLADFGITEQMVAAALAEEQKAVQREAEAADAVKKAERTRWAVFWSVFAAAALGSWVWWSFGVALVFVVAAMTVIFYLAVADELIGSVFGQQSITAWLKRRREAGKPLKVRSNAVLAAKSAYDKAVKDYDVELDRTRRAYWQQLDGLDFEHELAVVLRKAGYKAQVTRGSGDDGVDIWADRNNEKIAIQCKRYGGAVGPAVVRELYGVLMHLKADRGVVATTGYFTNGAVDFAADKPIELWTLDEILRLQEQTGSVNDS